MSVVVVDTSVLTCYLDIPHHNQEKEEVIDLLPVLVKESATLILPLATVLETGNHVAAIAEGNVRRDRAVRLVRLVTQALDPTAAATVPPWVLGEYWELDGIRAWMAEFPDNVMTGKGLADTSIIHEWRRQCVLNPSLRVYIWTYDEHLKGNDRKPVL